MHVVIRFAITVALLTATLLSDASSADVAPDGESVYLTHCSRCHQTTGKGIPGQYPSLSNTPALWQDRTEGIRALLEGRDPNTLGRALMPTHGYLGNEIIASTLSYVLERWGPGGKPFTAEEVAQQRLKLLQSHPPAYSDLSSESPLGQMPAGENRVTTAGPPMTTEEFSRARTAYYTKCTGCHGVLREGAAGSPLTADAMRLRGTEYLKSVINYGAVSGMPNWGTSGALEPSEVDELARFLQHPAPAAPDMDADTIRASWELLVPTHQRPETSQHDFPIDELFVVILHDTAAIAFIHGPTRKFIGTAATGRAPHRLRRSASGRYLTVICRDGTVSLIDLFWAKPRRVAHTRVGYEARAVGMSRFPGFEDRFVLAGAYWPPQLVLLDGRTLEPLRVISTRAHGKSAGGNDPERYHPEPRVTDIAGSFAHPEFIAHIKETGRTYLFPYDNADQLVMGDIATTGQLRAGSFTTDRRYYVTPSDRNAVVVLDTKQRAVAATVPGRVFAGSIGTSYHDPQFGPAWLTSTMTDSEVIVMGADPTGHPQHAWKIVRILQGAGQGSLFSASHPRSSHIWVDSPLSDDTRVSQSVAVFDKQDLTAPYRSVHVAGFAGIADGPRRALQPTYDHTGAEVWTLVWNPQDLTSAIVVLHDKTLNVLATISNPLLTTPTRIYNLAGLRQNSEQTGSATTAATVQSEPAIQAYDGAELYMANCAICHGTYGEGDGAVTPELRVALKDLRYISARNDGQFPRQFVNEIIDGRLLRAAHGPGGMPVWGNAFTRAEGFGQGAQARVASKIAALVDYVESMQLAFEE